MHECFLAWKEEKGMVLILLRPGVGILSTAREWMIGYVDAYNQRGVLALEGGVKKPRHCNCGENIHIDRLGGLEPCWRLNLTRWIRGLSINSIYNAC